MAFASRAYESKLDPETSHGRVAAWLADRPSSRVLDLGCSGGALGADLRAHGHEVTGVDIEEHEGVRERVDSFVRADLDDGVPEEIGDGYDVIVAADVLEHVVEPDRLLAGLADRLAPGGSVVACVPNFGHWYPRLRSTFGRFDYDRRGILDRGHLRFFTRDSFEGMVEQCGYTVRRREFLTLPVEIAYRGGDAEPPAGLGTKVLHALKSVDKVGTRVRPTVCAYQLLYEIEPVRAPSSASTSVAQ
jgi:SAM-dependent methyltransferase